MTKLADRPEAACEHWLTLVDEQEIARSANITQAMNAAQTAHIYAMAALGQIQW